MKKTLQSKSSYPIINAVLAIILLATAIGNGVYTSNAVKKIQALRQQKDNEQVAQNSLVNQQQFLNNNKESIVLIDQALPSKATLVPLIETIEKLGSSDGIAKSFSFTTTVPMTENNQHFFPFTMRLSATYAQAINFMREFEKIPYMTKITSLHIKTPNGLAGIWEVSINGKVYVQDGFKK